MVKKITEFSLYRWRYGIGYTIVGLAGLSLLLVALLLAPGGISEEEKRAVITTGSFTFQSIDPHTIIDAPYHILQWLSIRVLGLSDLSIKLPSFIIAVVTVIGAVGLLSAWFKRNVAILAAIIVVTTGQFLFVSQNGTPEIMIIFWAVWILFSAMMVSRRQQFSTFWKIALFGAIALSLYTPLSIYMIVALITAAIFHPHLRYLVRTMITWRLFVAIIFAIALVIPLAYAIYLDHDLIKTLIGLPNHMPNILDNLRILAGEYGNFIHPAGTLIATPIYGLTSILLAILGILRFFTTKYTARGYILVAWIVLLIPILLIDPRVIDVTFIPMMLLIAMGLDWLFGRWYSLFPRNPYARVAGLIPLSVLLIGIVSSGITRYVVGTLYDPEQATTFSQDLSIVHDQVVHAQGPLVIVVPKHDQAFYGLIEKYNHSIEVTSQVPEPKTQTTLISSEVTPTPALTDLSRILVDAKQHDADRFYLYQK